MARALPGAGNVFRPRRPSESPRAGLSRTELRDWLDAAESEGGHPYALACLLAINGLRVGEACGADVTDLAEDRWPHTLTIHGKGRQDCRDPVAAPHGRGDRSDRGRTDGGTVAPHACGYPDERPR